MAKTTKMQISMRIISLCFCCLATFKIVRCPRVCVQNETDLCPIWAQTHRKVSHGKVYISLQIKRISLKSSFLPTNIANKHDKAWMVSCLFSEGTHILEVLNYSVLPSLKIIIIICKYSMPYWCIPVSPTKNF